MRVPHKLLVSLSLIALYISCNKDFYPVGQVLLSDQTLTTITESYPVFTFQESVEKVETRVLNMFQLGEIEHPVFGTSEASFVTQLSIVDDVIFGDLRQELEDLENPSSITIIPENETVTAVYLELPFFTNLQDLDNDGVIDSLDSDPEDPNSNSDGDELTDIVETQAGLNPLSDDSDGDGILDHNDTENEAYDPENKIYQIDSIYGNTNASFDLKVYELTYFLNALDPAKNFESNKIYYSDEDYIEKGFYDATLHDDRINLNFEELRFNFEEDDPLTEDVDETTQVESRLTPRIRVPLDSSFFQERLLDLEGTPSLETNRAFQEALRGIIIKTENFSEELYMLLNLDGASVKVEYEYDKYDTNGTLEDESDDFILKETKELLLGLTGIRINTLKNETSNPDIQQQLSGSISDSPSEKLYVQGGKYHGKIRLFSNVNQEEETLLNELKNQNWLINQAKLVFYVDPDQSLVKPELFANRLYLFRSDTGAPLMDYFSDNSPESTAVNGNKTIFGGLLEYDDNNRPYKYTFDLTRHISDIIRNDSLNIDLGLVVTSNIDDNSVIDAFETLSSEESRLKYPRAATLSPFGTILLGSNPAENYSDKKVQLELTYSSY